MKFICDKYGYSRERLLFLFLHILCSRAQAAICDRLCDAAPDVAHRTLRVGSRWAFLLFGQ